MLKSRTSNGVKKYHLREREHAELLQDLLIARGVAETEQEVFLNPNFERDSHDPFLLPDMEKTVERILYAQKRGEQVAVWSDYDCDGIPGGVMLSEFLRRLGLSVRHYIPHRHKEGYGLNEEGIAELALENITLIITVDLGTSDVSQVEFAKKKNIDVIVTDHHLVQGDALTPGLSKASPLHPAYAVINPKRQGSRYPFPDLCGAGVAWKLVQAILEKNRPEGFAEGQEKWLLDLVGIATLSDMVPLVGENRMLAYCGLRVLRSPRLAKYRPGLASLFSLLRIGTAALTEDDIGFMVAPRLNAASRMGSPELAARLLGSRDATEAGALARELQTLNDERKTLVATTVKEVNKRLAQQPVESPLIVMGNPRWRPGVLGLVANSLAEAHGKPVFLWGRDGSTSLTTGGGIIRGSVRSGGSLNVVELMGATRDVFLHFGGHSGSGGFSLKEERVHELSARLMGAYTKHTTSDIEEEVVLDRELDLAEILHAHRDLKKMAPFGVGNAKPLFLFPRVSVAQVRTFGKTQNHLEVRFAKGGNQFSGVAFFSTPESFAKKFEQGATADIVGHVETDWRGQPRIRIVDIL